MQFVSIFQIDLTLCESCVIVKTSDLLMEAMSKSSLLLPTSIDYITIITELIWPICLYPHCYADLNLFDELDDLGDADELLEALESGAYVSIFRVDLVMTVYHFQSSTRRFYDMGATI